jgi:hypothetical protein
MTDNIISLNNKSLPVSIKYSKSNHGYSNFDNNNIKYLFELVINGNIIGSKYFRNLEDTKYSHLITLNHIIKLNDIKTYKASIKLFPSNTNIPDSISGVINHDQTFSNQKGDNIYIEFTRNDSGYALCTCFYTGLDHNKIFASPPN